MIMHLSHIGSGFYSLAFLPSTSLQRVNLRFSLILSGSSLSLVFSVKLSLDVGVGQQMHMKLVPDWCLSHWTFTGMYARLMHVCPSSLPFPRFSSSLGFCYACWKWGAISTPLRMSWEWCGKMMTSIDLENVGMEGRPEFLITGMRTRNSLLIVGLVALRTIVQRCYAIERQHRGLGTQIRPLQHSCTRGASYMCMIYLVDLWWWGSVYFSDVPQGERCFEFPLHGQSFNWI
ncbi:hypothetical protein FIBSPDRAFT_111093 [Athelia psychrophila]|uniref:Uncharacterized protein n=1 Tax=Athelia psychrophila TaxID=1759441 RepID=A0A166TEN0_9AGAM|nr:hypothetical protein FIBSPDRAFT_111093 [Fibularhizoctonia sp. CBS 109695]